MEAIDRTRAGVGIESKDSSTRAVLEIQAESEMRDQSFILRRGARNFTTLMAFLTSLSRDKEFQVTIGVVKKERSDLQNRALWGCAYKTLRDATGNEMEDLHTYFCGEYWGWQEYEVMGATRKRPIRSTTKDATGKRDVISTIHLQDFYLFIQQRSAETVGVFVPDPDPEWWSRMQEAA